MLSQSPFGLLTDWDEVELDIALFFRVSIAFRLADGLGPLIWTVKIRTCAGSQSPFGLLTDWEPLSELRVRTGPDGVSIAFRLADGLGLLIVTMKSPTLWHLNRLSAC